MTKVVKCCAQGTERLVAVFGEHQMYRCSACATAFVSPQPSEVELARFYDRFHLSDSEGGRYDSVEERMLSDFPEKVKFVQQFLAMRKGRLLDVGCGKGYFLKACVEDGIDAQGIDISASGVSFAVNKLGVMAQCCDVEAVGDSLGRFDVITLWATIEHLRDPRGYLRAAARLLTDDGVIVLDTGLADDWLDRALPGVNQWYDPPQHLWVFSRCGLEQLGADTGLVAVWCDCQYERTWVRRLLKIVRNGLYAFSMRILSSVARVSVSPHNCPRFPVGSLIRVVFAKSKDNSQCRR